MKRDEQTSPYYPILLNIRGKKCLVVGGGNVAFRKVQTLLEYDADIEVISSSSCSELNQMAKDGTIQINQKSYNTKDLKNAFIAIAATDNAATNESIASDAKRQGVLVNVVDDPNNSDFIVPSHFRRGDVIIAVSTSGRSPALARKIRSELEKGFKAEYAQLAILADDIRSELKLQSVTISSDTWQEVLNLNSLIQLIRRGKYREAKEIMLKKLKMLGQKKT